LRFFAPFTFLAFLAFLGLMSAFSCELASRDLPDSGTDAEAAAAPPPADAGAEIDTDCGCCAQTVVPLLPSCSGRVAIRIYSENSRCPPCDRPAAYALCQGGCYTECSCSLPAGYELEDGGILIEDASAQDQFVNDSGAQDEGGDARKTATDSGDGGSRD
jgi:hypothetical protein